MSLEITCFHRRQVWRHGTLASSSVLTVSTPIHVVYLSCRNFHNLSIERFTWSQTGTPKTYTCLTRGQSESILPNWKVDLAWPPFGCSKVTAWEQGATHITCPRKFEGGWHPCTYSLCMPKSVKVILIGQPLSFTCVATLLLHACVLVGPSETLLDKPGV